MYRIDSANNVPVLPAPVAAEGDAGYFNNAPGAGPGTKVTGDFLNMVQEEIANVVEGAGLELDRTNRAQLLAALRRLNTMPTGFRGATTLTTAPDGWILASGRTVGPTGSIATERANDDTLPLFSAYWAGRPDLHLYNAAGAPIARGASAAADWALACVIAVPDMNGRVGVGRDNMKGAAANRVTAAGCGVDGTVLGGAGGEQTHQLTVPELPAHHHTGAMTNVTGGSSVSSSGASPVNTGDTGGDQPHQNMPPFIVENMIIKL